MIDKKSLAQTIFLSVIFLSFKIHFMPIIRTIDTNRISQEEFGRLAYEVKGHVIDIHNDFGRFFDEKKMTDKKISDSDHFSVCHFFVI